MNKIIIIEHDDKEHVVFDVPVGHLRMRDNLLPSGDGELVFSVADERAAVGERTRSKDCDDDNALRIVCQTPEKAETIARAFIELAAHMRQARKK